MKTYISILRGINVSGQKLIRMEALRAMYDGLSFKKTLTYIQSGNVIFQCKETSSSALENKISKKILKEFGFDVPVLVKTLEEMEEVIDANPFPRNKHKDISFFHVTFLSKSPSVPDMEKVMKGDYGPDEFVFSGSRIYLYCPGGYGNSKLNNNFFEKKLGVTATTRNWRTVQELVRLAGAIN